MESLVYIFAFSFLYVTSTASAFEGFRLKDTKNDVVETIVVDQSGNDGNFKTIQSAIDSIPSGNNHWIKIFIRKGIYNEKIIISKDKPKIQMEANKASETIIQYKDGGNCITSATFRLYADFFVAINITFKNTYNEEKAMTLHDEINIAPAVVIVGDKAAFFGCRFYSIQDTVGDLAGRHYFHKCHIKGVIDFIWGGGQSIYQGCVIEVLGIIKSRESEKMDGGLIAGYITAQGRETEKDTSGFVFNGCSIVGVGKAYLGRAYRGYSRVLFYNTNMSDVIVPQGWHAWTYPQHVNKITYAEIDCYGPGAKNEGRVSWEKNMSNTDASFFTNFKTFLDRDGWIETLPPRPSFKVDENLFG